MKNRIRFYFYLPIILLIIFLFYFNFFHTQKLDLMAIDNLEYEVKEEEPKIKDILIEIESGSSFVKLLTENDLEYSLANKLYNLALDKYDMARIRAGNEILLSFDIETDELVSLYYKINNDEELYITRDGIENENWQVIRQNIDYDIVIKKQSATVESSMYQAAVDNDIDHRAIISLANAYQWSIDFSMDSQKGDTFKIIYEAKYLNDEYIGPGRVLAARYINSGRDLYVFYYKESEDNKGYFDKEGNSVQKMFLRAPLAYKYISSGFTTGSRYIQAFNISTGHRAIDYAAPMGTPIRAVGDGLVTFAAWQGSYGNMISIRHNGTYSTNYAHLSRFAVRTGQRVTQGDIIGYVGSTGLSTGPHLHYEMVKNGIKINPLTEVLPPGEAILEENKEDFYVTIKTWLEILKEL